MDDKLQSNSGLYPDVGLDSHDITYHENLATSIQIFKKSTYIRLRNRFIEIMMTNIDYDGLGVTSAFHELKIEAGLRKNYAVAVGMCKDNKVRMIGYVTTDITNSSVENFMTYQKPLRGASLIPTAPTLKFDYSKAIEITPDFPNTGNFVILRNKPLSYVNEFQTIDLYCQKLSEIEATRYSIIWQSKAMTGFIGEENDTDVNDAINNFFNGNPFFKAGKQFDKDDFIFHVDNTKVAEILSKLAEEYKDTENSLLSQLGINSVGTSKASGVSDLEASTSSLATTAYANVYLTGRNMGLRLFNEKFGTTIKAKMRSDLNIPDALNKEDTNDSNPL